MGRETKTHDRRRTARASLCLTVSFTPRVRLRRIAQVVRPRRYGPPQPEPGAVLVRGLARPPAVVVVVAVRVRDFQPLRHAVELRHVGVVGPRVRLRRVAQVVRTRRYGPPHPLHRDPMAAQVEQELRTHHRALRGAQQQSCTQQRTPPGAHVRAERVGGRPLETAPRRTSRPGRCGTRIGGLA